MEKVEINEKDYKIIKKSIIKELLNSLPEIKHENGCEYKFWKCSCKMPQSAGEYREKTKEKLVELFNIT